jgi:hypothetical protein
MARVAVPITTVTPVGTALDGVVVDPIGVETDPIGVDVDPIGIAHGAGTMALSNYSTMSSTQA